MRKTKIRTYGDKVYTNFRCLSVPEDSFTLSLQNFQVYLDNCAYKIVDSQMIDYLDDNLFETDED